MSRPPTIKRLRNKHQFNPARLNRGVVLVKSLPHGFFEEQLLGYFSQYGRVTRLRLARSERTGRSRHFAFVEFRFPEVAKIAADSMNNYLMFRHLVKTVYIPPDQQRWDYFKQRVKFVEKLDGTTELRTPYIVRREKHIKNVNKNVTKEQHAERTERAKWR